MDFAAEKPSQIGGTGRNRAAKTAPHRGEPAENFDREVRQRFPQAGKICGKRLIKVMSFSFPNQQSWKNLKSLGQTFFQPVSTTPTAYGLFFFFLILLNP